MIKYSGIYESSTPPPSTKALWVDGDVLKIYKNGSWRPVDDPKFKLTIDSILKAGSTNPVENGAIHSRFIGVDRDIEVNRNNITTLTRRTDEIDGRAKGAEALAKANEKNINSATAIAKQANELAQKNESNLSQVQATANTALTNSRENQNGVRSAQVTANEAKTSVEGLTIVTKRIEGDVSQLKELKGLNVVYPNDIRNLTTETDADVVKGAFVPVIGGSTGEVNTPHVGYLIKGADVGPDSTGPDSTIISVDIVKIEDIDCHKFVYVDNNTAIISVTVDLVNYKVMDKSTLANIEATSKVGTLRDLYISAGAKYNEATGFYELNGLTDITEEEMMICYKESAYLYLAISWRYLVAYSKLRTNIPMKSYARWILKNDLTESFEGCGLLEVVDLYTLNLEHQIDCSACASAFKNCAKLRVVKGLDLTHCSTPESVLNVFSRCLSLETIEIFNLVVSISFNDSPLLSKESVIHLISKAKPTSPITITLHPTTYAMATADPEIQAELEKQPNISLAEGEPSA